MRKRRIILFSDHRLLGEIIEQTFCPQEGFELIGHWPCDEQIISHLDCDLPDLVIIAEDGYSPEAISRLTAELLERFPDLPIFRVTLKRNEMQVYSSHMLPARREDFIELIRHLPSKSPDDD